MNKPKGQWRCRACGQEWHGSQLYDDPSSTAAIWTCADLGCGGVCDRMITLPALLECEEEAGEARPLQHPKLQA